MASRERKRPEVWHRKLRSLTLPARRKDKGAYPMSQPNDLSQPPSSDDQLHGNLQKAVDHIRLQPVPAESSQRVVERSINRTSVMPLRRRRWAMAFALTQIAAMLIVGILVVVFT